VAAEPARRPVGPGRRQAARPAGTTAENARQVHPGHDRFYVLDGTVRLVLGGRQHIVAAGEAASFSTMTPRCVVGVGGPAEILSNLDHHGERAHLDAPWPASLPVRQERFSMLPPVPTLRAGGTT